MAETVVAAFTPPYTSCGLSVLNATLGTTSVLVWRLPLAGYLVTHRQ